MEFAIKLLYDTNTSITHTLFAIYLITKEMYLQRILDFPTVKRRKKCELSSTKSKSISSKMGKFETFKVCHFSFSY